MPPGHHQPLRVWMLCLSFMGLNLSNEQIAHELDLNRDDAPKRTTQLREGIVERKPKVALSGVLRNPRQHDRGLRVAVEVLAPAAQGRFARVIAALPGAL
jgi:hypothetical protein